MNSILNSLMAIVIIAGSCIAQTTVKLNINHKQGTSAFVLNQSSKNNLDEDYNANRLEYYMSNLALEHDNGTITKIDSFWILVDVKGASIFDLGQFNITKLEAIHFSIGVEQAFNHLDPSKWSNGHPLAPRSPSMHWGWSAGYRFLAMEGKCGDLLNYTYEFHSLGDPYYFEQRIETSGTIDNGDLVVELNADYNYILENMTLGTGLIEHGDFPPNIQTLENMRDYVFTSLEGNGNSLSTVGINESSSIHVSVFPNPSNNGMLYISSAEEDLNGYQLNIHDALGKLIHYSAIVAWDGLMELNIENNGCYILTLVNENQEVFNQRIIVSQ